MATKNETTKPDKPAAKELASERDAQSRTARAQALDVPADTDPPQPDAERKRLRDAAAATAEGVDPEKLIEVDANRVEFTLVDDGTLSATQRKVEDPATTEDVPQDLIKVDPARVRFGSIDPSNGPAPVTERAQVVDALGIPIPAVSPPEAFRQNKAPGKDVVDEAAKRR